MLSKDIVTSSLLVRLQNKLLLIRLYSLNRFINLLLTFQTINLRTCSHNIITNFILTSQKLLNDLWILLVILKVLYPCQLKINTRAFYRPAYLNHFPAFPIFFPLKVLQKTAISVIYHRYLHTFKL